MGWFMKRVVGSSSYFISPVLAMGAVSHTMRSPTQSARGCTKRPGERAEEAKSEAGKYGRIEASEYKRSGKGGSYDLNESVCQ
jgi:hypothetical protein